MTRGGTTRYLPNTVEQDQHGATRVTGPLLGFTAYAAAQSLLTGIERRQMIKKTQMGREAGDEGRTANRTVPPLAASSPRKGHLPRHDHREANSRHQRESSLS